MGLVLEKESIQSSQGLQHETLPKWWKRDCSMLVNSFMVIQEIFPELSRMAQYFLPKMPRKIRASQNLRSISISHHTDFYNFSRGILLPWISFDSKEARNVLLYDIDHTEAWNLIKKLPACIRPHIVMDPHKGTALGIISLRTPVLLNGHTKPVELAEACHQMMAKYLNATPLPYGSVVKNPFGMMDNVIGYLPRIGEPHTPAIWFQHDQRKCWHTIPGAQDVELKDILNHLKADYGEVCSKGTRRQFVKRGDPSTLGRNCAVFDLVRWYAYDHYETDYTALLDEAETVNQTFSDPLPNKELASIAKSISRFMQNRYNGRKGSGKHINRGIMKLEASQLDIKKKQKLSAHRTNDIKREKTEALIFQALEVWNPELKLNQKNLSKISGIQLRTIQKKWNEPEVKAMRSEHN